MALADLSIFYPCAIDLGNPTTNIVLQTRSSGISPGISLSREQNGGAVDDDFIAVMGGLIAVTGSTSAVATFLGLVAIDGLYIDDETNTMNVFYTKGAIGGLRSTSSDHIKAAMKEVFVYPLTATAGHNQVATVDWKASPIYDGENNPIVITSNADLPTMDGAHEQFTCGPVKVNNSWVEGIQNISVNFGIREDIAGDAGRVWPRYVGIQSRQPSIVCRTTDASFLATLSIAGTAIATSTKVYFRKMDEGSTREADDVAVHLSFTATAGMIYPGDLRVNHPNYADQSFTIVMKKSGATDILLLNLATKIT